MKSKNCYLLSMGCVVLAGLLVLPVFTKAQELKAQAYLMTEYVVKPYMAKEFEAATIEEIGLFAGINFPYGGAAYCTEDWHYYFFIPIGKDAASLEKYGAAMTEAVAKLGENYETLLKRMAGAYEYHREMIVYLRPDLSYTPAESNIKPGESNYVFFEFAYILPGKEKEFEAFCKEEAAQCRKIGLRIGNITYQGEFGTDNPFYVLTMIARTQADTFAEEERLMKILSPEELGELKATSDKGPSFFRKLEIRRGYSLPGLSYTPRAK
jgi:hypothetical protein